MFESSSISRLKDSGRLHQLLSVIGVLAFCLLFSAPAVGLQIRAHPGVFRVDEHMYIDYLYRVDAGRYYLPHGQLLTAAAVQEIRCRGTEPIPPPPTPPARNCKVMPYGFTGLPDGGYNSADIYPPTYFMLTDVGARLLMDVGVTTNLVTAGRLTGVLWMALGMTVVFFLARELGAKKSAAWAALLLTGCTPWFLAFWFHVTPDAMSLPMGGLVVLAALKWDRKQLGFGWMIAASVLSIAIKPVNIVAVAAMGLFFAIRAVRRLTGCPMDEPVAAADSAISEMQRPSRWAVARHDVMGIAYTSGVGLLALLSWQGYRTFVAPPGATTPYDHLFPIHGFDITWLSRYFASFIRIQNLGWSDAYQLSTLFPVLVAGTVASIAFSYAGRLRIQALALSTLSLALIGPFGLGVMTALATGSAVPPQVRYGLSLMAPMVAIAATTWRTKSAQYVIRVMILLLELTSLSWAHL